MKLKVKVIIACFLMILATRFAYTKDIHVPGDYPTIQEAIDAANSGDRVLVAAGVYVECITMKNEVDLIGEGTDITTIDGSSCLIFLLPAIDTTIGDGVDDYMGVTTLVLSSGSTIFASGVTAIIEGFTIINGSNYGIQLWDSSSVVVQKNIIKNNSRGFGLSGGSNTIQNNLIINNTGWAIADGSGNHLIFNNTIDNNGTGYYVGNGPFPTITNNIITNNQIGIDQTHSGVATVSYNDVWGNGTNYLGLAPGPGDISADPLFVDQDNSDYHLQASSPCIDAGTPDGAPPDDIDGNPRDEFPDMGAYEYQGVGTGFINGYVTDVAGNPLRALVIATNAETKENAKAVTDVDGYYEIPDLEPGTYWVLCIKRGYKPGIRKAEVAVGEKTTVDFRLRPKPD